MTDPVCRRVPLRTAGRWALWISIAGLVGCQRSAPSPAVFPPASATNAASVIERVHFSVWPEAGRFRAGHRSHQLEAQGDAVSLWPILANETWRGASEPALRLRTVRRTPATAPIITRDGALEIADRDHTERWRNTKDGFEQTWSFAQRPTGEDLVVAVAVQGYDFAVANQNGLHFRSPKRDRGFVYSHATWVDANRNRVAVPARWNDSTKQIEMYVDAATLAETRFPAVLDPTIGPEVAVDTPVGGTNDTNGFGSAVSYLAAQNTYLVTWLDSRGGGGGVDVLAARFDSAGGVLDTYGIPVHQNAATKNGAAVAAGSGGRWLVTWTNGTQLQARTVDSTGALGTIRNIDAPTAAAKPALAYSATRDRYLAAYEASGNVRVQALDAATGAASGSPLTVTSSGTNTAPALSFVADKALLVFETDGDVVNCIVTLPASPGAPTAGAFNAVAASPADVESAPRVANNGVLWHVVWQNDNDGNADVHFASVDATGKASASSAIASTAANEIAPNLGFDGTHYLVGYLELVTPFSGTIKALEIDPASPLPVTATASLGATNNPSETIGVAAEPNVAWLVTWAGVTFTRVESGSFAPGPAKAGSQSGANLQTSPAIAYGSNEYLAVWHDNRSGGSRIRAARFSKAGALLGSSFEISSGAAIRANPTVIFDGNTYWAAWDSDIGGSRQIEYSKIDTNGVSTGVVRMNLANNQSHPSLAPAKVNGVSTGVWLVWRDDTAGTSIRGRFIANSGAAGTVKDISASDFAATGEPRIAHLGSNQFLVVWRFSNFVQAKRIDASGNVDGSTTLVGVTGLNDSPVVAGSQDRWLVVWVEPTVAQPSRIIAKQVRSDGSIVETIGQINVVTTGLADVGVRFPSISERPGVGSLTRWQVAYEERSTSDDALIRTALVSSNGLVNADTGPGFALHSAPVWARAAAVAAGAVEIGETTSTRTLIAYVRDDVASDDRVFVRLVTELRNYGDACTSGAECPGGACVDGVCCESACGGGVATDCQACSVAAGGTVDGKCTNATATVVCRAKNGECDVADTCTGSSPACPTDGKLPDTTSCTDTAPTNCYQAQCVSGACVQQPTSGLLNGTACHTDGTSSPLTCYACAAGTCSPVGSGIVGPGCVDDGNACTDDYCNGSGSCVHPNDNTNTCGDGICESCSAGVCTNIPAATQGIGCTGTCRECNGSGTCINTPSQQLRAGCTADSNACTDDYCDGGGACVHPADDTNTCGDGVCEFCSAGACTQVPDNTQATGCNATCQVCNGAGACRPVVSGALGGGCAADANSCTDDFCDGTTGASACKHVNDDTNTCGTCKRCAAGACGNVGAGQAGNGCNATCNQCNGAGACIPTPNSQPGPGCTAAATECSGADVCNGGGVCLPKHATAGVGCGDGECNECDGLGGCIPTPDTEAGPNCDEGPTECSDADRCDGKGSCDRRHRQPSTACGDGVCNNCDGAGACTSSTIGAPGPQCVGIETSCSLPDTCDASGSCSLNHKPDGIACGGTCFECEGGGCIKTVAGAPGPGCDAIATECSEPDTCDGSGGCLPNHKPAGTACGDSSPGDCRIARCNGAGACVQDHLVLDDGQACGDGVCNECQAGACVATSNGQQGPGCQAAGTECSNPGSCDGSGACNGNPKAAGTACVDLDPTDCKVAKCNGSGACNQAFSDVDEGTACGDGICNQCASGVCQPTAAGLTGVGCNDDGNPCTFDQCSGAGTCIHPPKTGVDCDDGNACTYADRCSNVATCAGTTIVCADDVCGTRTCNGTSQCTVIPHDDVECDADNDKCTPNDKCKAGVCVADTAVECVQRDCFTTAACNKETGDCESQPTNGGTCGLTGCSTAGVCNNGVCSGVPVDCSSLDAVCTVGLCDVNAPGVEEEKCRAQRVPNGTSCSPDDLCLLDPVCVAGKCVGDRKTCTATATCRVAACAAATGACVDEPAPVGTACQSNNPCVQNAACDATGNCTGSVLPDTTPCSLADCLGPALCIVGECICTPAVDMAMTDAAPGMDLSPSSDLATGGAPKQGCGGCGVSGGISGEGMLLLLVLAALRRRRGVRSLR